MRLFPGVAFRGPEYDRRAWIIGTAFDVWEIVSAGRDFDSTEALLSETSLSKRQVRLALAYAEHFPEEIEDAIQRNRISLNELRRELPGAAIMSLDA